MNWNFLDSKLDKYKNGDIGGDSELRSEKKVLEGTNYELSARDIVKDDFFKNLNLEDEEDD